MKTGFSLSTTTERLSKVDGFIGNNSNYADRAAFINDAIDKFFEAYNAKFVIDFMYFIGVPLFLFLISVGLTLYLVSLFFYIITGISGIYLMIFFFLFYNRYKGIKWKK